jgi:adenylylsulfate kinase
MRPGSLELPAVIWFTGLPASGKSSLADWLAAELGRTTSRVERLDGDAIRQVFPETGFTKADRDAHIRRVGFLASRLEAHGVTVVASFVSPYRDTRHFVRSLCHRFVEVYVSTPLEECERRDPKELYARARRGDLLNVTGISDPYEAPDAAELTIDTTRMSVESAGRQMMDALVAR